MAFDPADLEAHDSIFAIPKDEWEQSGPFHQQVLERQNHQEERERAFLTHEGDCFAIYQVGRDDPQNVRFMNLKWLHSHGLSPERHNYDLIYTAPLNSSGNTMVQLEKLYERFNLQKPADFHSPSMSVSDIVAIRQAGQVSCHYCDSIGFTEIPGFLEYPLRNTEMAVEDDYNMIDGIINNGPRKPAADKPQEKKKSVLKQLKEPSRTEHKKTASKKSAERER